MAGYDTGPAHPESEEQFEEEKTKDVDVKDDIDAVQLEAQLGERHEPEEEVEEEEPKPKYTIEDVKTAPPDPRFPVTNQTKHCYTRYIEFHKCQKERGEGAPECQKYKRWYYSLCPLEWIERWDEQRAQGIFCGPY